MPSSECSDPAPSGSCVTGSTDATALSRSREPSTRIPSSRVRLSLSLLLLFLIVSPSALFAAEKPGLASAPDFTLPTKSGPVSLHDLRGKVVLVDFWASWCVPCRQSFPWMGSMDERYAADGLVVVAINLDKDRDTADAFLGQFPAPFVVAYDPAGTTAEAFRVDAMPSSFIVSRTGEIIATHAGFDPKKAKNVEEQIKEALSK